MPGLLSDTLTFLTYRFKLSNTFGDFRATRLRALPISLLLTVIVVITSGCSAHKQNVSPTVSTQSLTVFSADDYIDKQHMSKQQIALIREICSWQGTPYQYGGADKGKGTDCSGLILRVFLDVTDIKLPRNSAEQAKFCKSVKQSHVKPCDLVFFATGSDPDKVSHVGLLLNSEMFIHSSSSKGVIITRLDSPWWNKRIIGFGRIPKIN